MFHLLYPLSNELSIRPFLLRQVVWIRDRNQKRLIKEARAREFTEEVISSSRMWLSIHHHCRNIDQHCVLFNLYEQVIICNFPRGADSNGISNLNHPFLRFLTLDLSLQAFQATHFGPRGIPLPAPV